MNDWKSELRAVSSLYYNSREIKKHLKTESEQGEMDLGASVWLLISTITYYLNSYDVLFKLKHIREMAYGDIVSLFL